MTYPSRHYVINSFCLLFQVPPTTTLLDFLKKLLESLLLFREKSVTVFAVIAVIGVFYYVQILYVGSWYLLSTGDDTQIISVYYTVHYSIATVILYVVNLEK